MKKLLFLFCMLPWLVGCGGGKADVSDKDTLDTVVDSVMLLPADKEDSIIAQTKVPKAADGVFYDFISSFCQNSKYQKSRIVFPLTRIVNGQQQSISEKDWRFSKLHYNSDIYTVFFPNTAAVSLETNKKIDKVRVQWYNVTTEMATNYQFEKLDNQWMLTSINEYPLSQDSDYDFVHFFSQFASDMDYQTTHLADVLTYNGIDLDNDDDFEPKMVKDKKISSSEWDERMIPELPSDNFSNIDFGQELTGSERVVSVEAPSSGFCCYLHFKKHNDTWVLHQIENY